MSSLEFQIRCFILKGGIMRLAAAVLVGVAGANSYCCCFVLQVVLFGSNHQAGDGGRRLPEEERGSRTCQQRRRQRAGREGVQHHRRRERENVYIWSVILDDQRSENCLFIDTTLCFIEYLSQEILSFRPWNRAAEASWGSNHHPWRLWVWAPRWWRGEAEAKLHKPSWANHMASFLFPWWRHRFGLTVFLRTSDDFSSWLTF